ncbi:molybdopterin oxidoreductase family protein [Calidifontibacter sp. DB0510]|uniref:Molybdopterin oxidoreductase family protein n=1 Tax=Metallococcus carri TaxID=1656884 RepID=A0A967B328_9MICO|nr:molybdopterin oxidoreductase family protein [Metallococcus carri]NHN57127.1 molybdopterin oxidoreductase family protein [Metallococcus carri]NOP39004.1 molybdopterin oxidoreductase family protein [Calidifontibacter sp. DB2511S]
MVDTHCPYCALQCAMTLSVGADGVAVQPRDFPTNRGGLCQKGWTSAQLLSAPDRITTPLMRDASGELRPVTWEAAYDRIVSSVRAAQGAVGADGVAVFGGGGLTNEKAYTLGKFARIALRTRLIDYNGRFCMSSAAAAGNRAFGVDRGLPFPLEDLGGADAVLLVGSNLADTMPPSVVHLDGVRRRGGLIVVDPRRSATAALTENGSGVHLQPIPGTDLVLLLGLVHLVLQGGAADEAYLAERVSGWDAVATEAALWWPERVSRETGIPVSALRQAADLLVSAAPHRGGRGAYVLTGRGAEQHAHGTATVTAAIDLALALGLPGRPGSGYGCLTGQGNGQGGREHGQKADQLPGYRSITDPVARQQVAAVWGVDEADLPGAGLPAVELLDRLGRPGGPRVLFVHGANPAVSGPDAARVRDRLAALDLLVVCDFVPSETARLADVVLPVPQWAEEEGTMTSLEGRLLRRRRAVEPPAEVRDELRIWAELAQRLDTPVRFATDPREVFEELCRASEGGLADYSAANYDLLESVTPLHWPVTSADGTPRLFLDRFATPDGRARASVPDLVTATERLGPDSPLHLLTGRVLQHYQSGAQTSRVPDLVRAAPRSAVQVHPVTAQRLGLDEGSLARITSERGDAVARVVLSDHLRPECVFVPFHFDGEVLINDLTDPATDPVSGMPQFKACAVQVAPAGEVPA